MNKWILTGIAAIAMVSLGAYAADAKAEGKKAEGKKMDCCAKMMEKFDANKDGKIDAAELAAMPEKARACFEKCDTNKDGVIDDAEKAACKKAMADSGCCKKKCGKKDGKKDDKAAAPAATDAK